MIRIFLLVALAIALVGSIWLIAGGAGDDWVVVGWICAVTNVLSIRSLLND